MVTDAASAGRPLCTTPIATRAPCWYAHVMDAANPTNLAFVATYANMWCYVIDDRVIMAAKSRALIADLARRYEGGRWLFVARY